MSQLYKNGSGGGGPLPPTVATSYVTDINSPAIPAANVLNVPGGTVSTNNINGVQTDGSSGGDTLTVQLTNRITGTLTTADGVSQAVITFPLPTTGNYAFDVNISAYNTTDTAGASYAIFVGVKSVAGSATKLNLEDKIVNEEAAMSGCDVSVSASGNSAVFSVTGIAGKTIDWVAVGTYVFAG